jgi:phosphomannomutase
MQQISIAELMASSGASFGTTGVRGLATALTDKVSYLYTRGFIQYLRASNQLPANVCEVGLAGDLRESTDRILGACAKAVQDAGMQALPCGKLPSPAIAYYGSCRQIPTLMVTGSHIPEDRNGIKFNTAAGEISKADEAGIKAQVVQFDPLIFDPAGMLREKASLVVDPSARQCYLERYLQAFPPNFLDGKTVIVYLHSTVGGPLMVELYERLGARVIGVSPSSVFVPVDTEAIRPEDERAARLWVSKEYGGERAFAVLSGDGDCDRPLVADEQGNWLRGDVLGILAARYLKARGVVVVISCNTALEKCGLFARTLRTKIGSSHVMAGIHHLLQDGVTPVVGYEANGGFLLGSAVRLFKDRQALSPLLTRDAVITHLAAIGLALEQKMPLSQLVAQLPARFTASDRLKNFPTARSQEILARLQASTADLQREFPEGVFGKFQELNLVDGLRATTTCGDIIHLRASGNAPEFRCYVESDKDPKRILEKALQVMEKWR